MVNNRLKLIINWKYLKINHFWIVLINNWFQLKLFKSIINSNKIDYNYSNQKSIWILSKLFESKYFVSNTIEIIRIKIFWIPKITNRISLLDSCIKGSMPRPTNFINELSQNVYYVISHTFDIQQLWSLAKLKIKNLIS